MKGSMKIRKRRFRALIMLFLTLALALSAGTAELRADESYPFEKYYNPEEDGWANEERVNMDGELNSRALRGHERPVHGFDRVWHRKSETSGIKR